MKTGRIILILTFLIFLNQNSFGTAQIPDFLIYRGDTLSIFANPLESYFDNHFRPDSVFAKYGYNSTACWRGYIGYWELKNDSLFLIELQGDSSKIDLSLIFKDRDTKGKIFADWYNFPILNPYGKLLFYEHMGYGSIYEFEKEFSFDKGILTNIKTYDNSKSIKSIYTQDQKLLLEYIQSHIDYSTIPKPSKPVKVFIQIAKSDENGKIDSVVVLRGYNKIYDKEAIRVIKSIPEWDVIYSHGEFIYRTWMIPVVFEKKK
jgi:hypothetical protein